MKRKDFWLALVPPILMLAIQSLVSSAGVFVVILRQMAGGADAERILERIMGTGLVLDPDVTAVVLTIYSLIAIAVFAPWWSKKRVAFDGRRMSFKCFKIPLLIIGTLLFVAGTQLVSEYLLSFMGALLPAELDKYTDMMKTAGYDRQAISPVLIIYTAILAPITEELAFRGLTMGYFRKSLPSFALANLIQALIFGFIHLNLLQGTYAFLLGLLLGYVAYKTGSLLLSIVVHICFNASSFIIQPLVSWVITGGAFKAFAILVLSMMAAYVGVHLLIYSQPMAKER